MIRKFVLPVLALVGVVYAATVVAIGSQPAPVAPPVTDPSRPPFASYIAGSGIIEAQTQEFFSPTSVYMVLKDAKAAQIAAIQQHMA